MPRTLSLAVLMLLLASPIHSATGESITCVGEQFNIFDNWNIGGVGNGGMAPTFSTRVAGATSSR